MKDKLTIQSGAVGEQIVTGRDNEGDIRVTLSLFPDGSIYGVGRNIQRMASLVIRRADAESWAGGPDTTSGRLETWAQRMLERLAEKTVLRGTMTVEQKATLVLQFGTQLLTGDGVFSTVEVKGDKAFLTTFNGLKFEYHWKDGKWAQ